MADLKAWGMFEDVGFGIINPRKVFRLPIPEGLSPEQLDRIDKEIDKLNEEMDDDNSMDQVSS